MDHLILRGLCVKEFTLHRTTLPSINIQINFKLSGLHLLHSADALGGYIELRALSEALNCPIMVHIFSTMMLPLLILRKKFNLISEPNVWRLKYKASHYRESNE